MREMMIQDQAALEQVCPLLEDLFLEPSRIGYDEVGRDLVVPFFYRSEQGKVTTKRSWFVRNHEYPLLQGRLRIRDVVSHTVKDPANIGRYTISAINFDAKRLRIKITAHEDLEVAINVDCLNFTVEWLDAVVGRMSERSVFALGCWGPIEWIIRG